MCIRDSYKGEERLLAKEWYEQQLANYPDVLTVAQVCEVTGYQRHTILKWCSKGLLKTILQTPKYMTVSYTHLTTRAGFSTQ